MNRRIVIFALSFVLVFTVILGASSENAFAYEKNGWRLALTSQSYKWGANLGDGLIKTGWRDAASSWKSKTSNNVKINFFYHQNSVHFLARFTEKDSNYYGKMLTTYNPKTNIVIKYEGYLNDYAVKNSNVAQSTGVHELGHVLGLAHNTGTSIMNSNRNRNVMIAPQSDDINGVKDIYK